MSFQDISNLIKQKGSISWNNIDSALKQGNAGAEQIKTAQSIFTKLDKNGDGSVNEEEWNSFYGEFEKADTNNDGIISDEEAQAAPENSILKTVGTKINGFASLIRNAAANTGENPVNTGNITPPPRNTLCCCK